MPPAHANANARRAAPAPRWALALVLALVLPAAGAVTVDGVWVVDPHDPGPDLPPRGRSLFDLLFTAPGADGAREYRVPFPFADLVAALEQQVPRLPGGASSLKKVLIPLGRSLQRNAAAPDFFASPRVVLAVDSEPDGRQPRPVFLKDRLFIGYQEAAAVLEVISYNEDAARFEFQVVEDYRGGGRAEVRYANRALCTSCHQNGGPIFSEAGWEETNSTPRIAERLAQVRHSFHTVPARRSSVDAAAIDNATDRANLLPAYQLQWREACGSDVRVRTRCRAAALAAMLLFRLNAFSYFDAADPGYRDDYAAVFEREWQLRWPQGLVLPDPDIPNRSPPFITRNADVPREFDPLNTRPPQALWRPDPKRLVTGLAELLPRRDLLLLDRGLSARARAAGAAQREYRGPCTLKAGSMLRSGTLLEIDCRIRDARERELNLIADAIVTPERFVNGAVNTLRLSDGTYFGKLVLVGGEVRWQERGRAVALTMRHRRGGLTARLSDGNAIEGMQLSWQAPAGALLPPTETVPAEAVLTVLEDYTGLEAGIATLVAAGASGALGGDTFRGTRLMQALLQALDLPHTDWCCDLPHDLPPARADALAATATDKRLARDRGLRTFYQYCSTCHRGNTQMPPGFLRGEPQQVARNLRQCAPRILYRLGMWQLAEHDRAKSPMPPAHALPQAVRIAGNWPRSAALAAMQMHARERAGPDADALLAGPYEALPACLPGSS